MKSVFLLFTLFLLTNLAQATLETNTTKATNYLTSKQSSDGQFDDLGVFVTAPAITALHTVNATKYENEIRNGANYIAKQHRSDGCISTWCSKLGHIPDESGISLWALAETNNLNLLPQNGQIAINKIKESQTTEGDFASDEGTNTEHTNWALISLSATHSLTQNQANKAINYIGTHWQEKNGAIKQSNTAKSGVNGPQEYYTALTVWALAYSNQTNNSVYEKALANLLTKSENCFANSTHVLTIATTKLALDASNIENELEQCISNLQHSNGGFKDSIRASDTVNSFDTAFALLSVATTNQEKTPTLTTPQINETNENKTSQNTNITIIITANNQTQTYSNLTCTNGYECLKQIANITCKWYNAPGLQCNGVNKACFIEQINDQSNEITMSEWSLTLNGKLSEKGISCLQTQTGDKIELKLQNNFNPYELGSEEKTNYDSLIILTIAVIALIILITLAIKKKKR